MRVKCVQADWGNLGEFLAVSSSLYPNERGLRLPELYERKRLNLASEPFWKHARGQLYVARRGSRAVGRILVYKNDLDGPSDDHAGFCLFEAIHDAEVANALFDAAAGWANDRGLHRLRGPMAFSLRDEVGVLVEGFEHPVRLCTAFNPPYYNELYVAAGFRPLREFGAYVSAVWELPLPPTPAGEQIVIKSLDPRRPRHAIDEFTLVYNEALCDRFGFAPITQEEAAQIFDLVVTFGDPQLVWQARIGQRPVGFLLALPDLNESLAQSRTGLLALAKARWLKRGLQGIRVISFGVITRYRSENLLAHLLYSVWQAAIDAGAREAEFSPVDLGDREITGLLERVGSRRIKRYVVYER